MMLRNLLSNAIKFSPLHQKVEVELSELPGKVCLQVKDYGLGIPHETLRRLVKSDKQSSTPGTAGETGTGFGLRLCCDMAQLMGGQHSRRKRSRTGQRLLFVAACLTGSIKRLKTKLLYSLFHFLCSYDADFLQSS